MASTVVLIEYFGAGFVILNAHRFRFKIDRCPISQPGGNQILDDFLLGINGDGLADQILKIDAMALSVKAQFDSLML